MFSIRIQTLRDKSPSQKQQQRCKDPCKDFRKTAHIVAAGTANLGILSLATAGRVRSVEVLMGRNRRLVFRRINGCTEASFGRSRFNQAWTDR